MQFCTDSYFSSEVKVYAALSHKIALYCTVHTRAWVRLARRVMEKKTVGNNKLCMLQNANHDSWFQIVVRQ